MWNQLDSKHKRKYGASNDEEPESVNTKAPDKEKLRALFYPDSDSDDDPIAAIKRRQIAANKRRRELKKAELKNSSPDVLSRGAAEKSESPKRHCSSSQHMRNDRNPPKSKSLEIIAEKPAIDAIDRTTEQCKSKPIPSHSILSSSTTSTLRQEYLSNYGNEDAKREVGRGNQDLDSPNNTKTDAPKPFLSTIQKSTQYTTASSRSTQATTTDASPITAKDVKTPKNVLWTSLHSQHLLVRHPVVFNPRDKVAGFDLDQTLVNWIVPNGSWPTSVHQYELWNANVVDKLRELDKDGYKLVIFSNQGGIKGALQGKTAAKVKTIIDWIAKKVGRPIFAICSTMSGSEYHKPNTGMWVMMESRCNAGLEVRPDASIYVGDSDGTGEGYQLEGVDKAFAENVGQLKFYSVKEFFGESNLELRRSTLNVNSPPPFRYIVPDEAILERTALLGGYLQTPILLILVGVQGSGKSTFCQSLGQGWCHLSQDTIDNGKPGERKAVEVAAKSILKEKQKSVVIDRMHLDATQRQYFVQIGKEARVKVHCLVFLASKEVIVKRVSERINHPGSVEGERGAQLAIGSLSRLMKPTYEEGFSLISCSCTNDAPILDAYRSVGSTRSQALRKSVSLCNCDEEENIPHLQMITMGTLKLKKQDVSPSISLASRLGFTSIDTAPTYGNESTIGNSLQRQNKISLTIKVPKRAVHPAQARDEVTKSLSELKRKCVDTVLLHWPSDLIEADSLVAVWKELELMKKEGLCKVLGVCNFSISALLTLIPACTVKPSINQVERHPLLPQYDLLDYCSTVGITVQAHTPLGCGNLLQHSVINRVAKESGITPAQCCLSWNIRQGVPVVVKSANAAHLREIATLLHDDFDSLALSGNHMKELSELGKTNHRFVAPSFMFKPGSVYSWEEATPEAEYVLPVIPNPQYSIGPGEEKISFFLFLAIRENKSNAFSKGIASCEACCPPMVHSHCFQRDGTRHITLYQGELTKNEALTLRYEQNHTDSDVSLPLEIAFDGWMPWEAGCYLRVEQSCKKKLESLVAKVVGLPASPTGSRKCDHLSLYRRRAYHNGDEFRVAVANIKKNNMIQSWGSVEGISIRLKMMQGAYEDCIVLA